jgi:hypothetical protein
MSNNNYLESIKKLLEAAIYYYKCCPDDKKDEEFKFEMNIFHVSSESDPAAVIGFYESQYGWLVAKLTDFPYICVELLEIDQSQENGTGKIRFTASNKKTSMYGALNDSICSQIGFYGSRK